MLINLIVFAFAVLFERLGRAKRVMGIRDRGFLGSFALYNGYFILLEWLLNGQTPGKRMLHIRVIKQGGYALRFFDTLLRNLLRVVDFLPLFYGVGLTSLLLTRDSQRLGDLVAGTLVVYQEPVETESLLPDLPAPERFEAALPAVQLAAIPNEAISLADQYLRSRTELAPRPRQEIAAELVESHPRNQRAGAAARARRRELPGIRRQASRASPSMVIPNFRSRLNSLLDQPPRDLLPVPWRAFARCRPLVYRPSGRRSDAARDPDTGPTASTRLKMGINWLSQRTTPWPIGERRLSVLRLHDSQTRRSLADAGAAERASRERKGGRADQLNNVDDHAAA